jgi:hypothetical protein
MTFDFEDGNGPVPARQHSNGGGWVADTARVADTAYVGPDAKVSGNAWVCGNAKVSGDAWVFGDARVCGNAQVSGNVQVYGNARVCGDAWVSGNAEVFGDAWVFGDARVFGNAKVTSMILTANRSDGYCFSIFNCADGIPRITAGCRYFTVSEAVKHWEDTRGGTKLGKESILIVNHLKSMYDLQDLQNG